MGAAQTGDALAALGLWPVVEGDLEASVEKPAFASRAARDGRVPLSVAAKTQPTTGNPLHRQQGALHSRIIAFELASPLLHPERSMDFLKSAVASAISKGPPFPYTFGDRVDLEQSIWTLHNGTKRVR